MSHLSPYALHSLKQQQFTLSGASSAGFLLCFMSYPSSLGE